jgi:hypothetical protein
MTAWNLLSPCRGVYNATHRTPSTNGSQHPTKTVTCENNQWSTGIFRGDFHGNVFIRTGVEEMLLPVDRLLRG